jgi:hypothetical protein
MAIGTNSPIHTSQSLFSIDEPMAKALYASKTKKSKKSLEIPPFTLQGLKRCRKYKQRVLELFQENEIHPMDEEPGYDLSKKALSFDILQDLQWNGLEWLSLTNVKTSLVSLEEPVLCKQDRMLKRDIQKFQYGYSILNAFEMEICDCLSLDSSTRPKTLCFSFKDSLLRCIAHACCRYYGLKSWSQTDEQGIRRTFCDLESINTLPKRGFCDYFYPRES